MNKELHFSSASSEWETPAGLFYVLNEEFKFTLDVCATKENAKCKRYFNIAKNGLKQKWSGVCFMNPPYGRTIGDWVKKAWAEVQNATTVCLLPARTDTEWWHCFVDCADEIRFLRGRLKFSGHENSAPFPSCIVVFRKKIAIEHRPIVRCVDYPRNWKGER